MTDAMLALVVSECRNAVDRCEGDLKAKLAAAMNVAKDHWMVLDKDTQFRGAVGAVMIHYGESTDEYRRIKYEVDQMRKLSAMIQASQAGLTVGLPESSEAEPRPEPVGIMRMWQDAIKATK